MSHVISFDSFQRWREQTGDGELAEHLVRRKRAMQLSPVIVICSNSEDYAAVERYLHDYELYNLLQIEQV